MVGAGRHLGWGHGWVAGAGGPQGMTVTVGWQQEQLGSEWKPGAKPTASDHAQRQGWFWEGKAGLLPMLMSQHPSKTWDLDLRLVTWYLGLGT